MNWKKLWSQKLAYYMRKLHACNIENGFQSVCNAIIFLEDHESPFFPFLIIVQWDKHVISTYFHISRIEVSQNCVIDNSRGVDFCYVNHIDFSCSCIIKENIDKTKKKQKQKKPYTHKKKET